MSAKLPVVGTSAASTKFCGTEIRMTSEHPDALDFGHSLFVDGNGKITRTNGTLDDPRPNAFSLPAQAVEDRVLGALADTHCPQSTPACRSTCYVDGLAKHAAETYAAYQRNASTIREILAVGEDGQLVDDEYANQCAWHMAEWITANAPGGFRWHVSGDVFSREYAEWIAVVCERSPTVQHWIYTRSFRHLEPLMRVSTTRGGNLAINLSCDRDNYELARRTSRLWITAGGRAPVITQAGVAIPTPEGRPLRLCYLSVEGETPPDLPEGSVIFPDYKIRGGTPEGLEWFDALRADYKSYVCPVDFRGKSEQRRCGPCDRCLT